MPDPLDATKRQGDIARAKDEEEQNKIVQKALKRRKRYPSPRKVAAAVGEEMLKEALVPGAPEPPAAPAAPSTPAAPPAPAAPAAPATSWTGDLPASKGVDAETGVALDAAASGAIDPTQLDDRQRGVIQGMHQGAQDKVDPPNWFERMGRGVQGMWGKWGDLTNQMGGETYGPLMKYGLPAAGGGLLAYLLYRLFSGGGRDKYSYDKLAEFPEGFGKTLTDCQYGKEALPSMTSKAVPCQTDTNNGWSNRKVVKKAGFWSEYFGNLNPLNLYGGSLLGAIPAAFTETRSLKDQAAHDTRKGWGAAGTVLSNLLIPGVGPYRSMKRLGTSIRGPELKQMKAEHRVDREEEERREKEEKAPAEEPKEAADRYSLIKEGLHPAALGAMGGAGLGGLGGMAYGALMPGEDEEGEQRSRVSQALLKGLMGAGLGAGAGAGAGGLYGAMDGQEPELPPDAGMSDPGSSGQAPGMGGRPPEAWEPGGNPRGIGFEETAANIPSGQGVGAMVNDWAKNLLPVGMRAAPQGPPGIDYDIGRLMESAGERAAPAADWMKNLVPSSMRPEGWPKGPPGLDYDLKRLLGTDEPAGEPPG